MPVQFAGVESGNEMATLERGTARPRSLERSGDDVVFAPGQRLRRWPDANTASRQSLLKTARTHMDAGGEGFSTHRDH